MSPEDAIEARERLLQLGDAPDPEPTDEDRQAAAYEAERARFRATTRWEGPLV